MANNNFEVNLKAKVDVSDIKKQLTEVSKTETLKLKADNSKELIGTISKLKDEFGSTYTITQKLNKEGTGFNTTLKVTSKSVKEVGNATKTANAQSKTFGETLEGMGRKLQSINGIYQATKNLVVNFGQFIQPILEFDEALTEMKKVSDLSGDALNQYTKKLGQAGQEVARTRAEMTAEATEFIKSGYSEEDAATLARVSALFANIADDELEAGEAAGLIVSQLKAFNFQADQAEGIADAINEVSNNFAVSSTDIATGLSKTSSAMAVLGNDFNETIGLVTAGTEILHGQASKTARGLRTIGNNFANAAKEADSFSVQVGGVNKSISLIDEDTGDIKSTFDIFRSLSKYWDKMSNSEKQAVALTYAGKNQFEVFSAVMSNFEQAVNASNTALNSQGSAVEENARYAESFEAKINKLKSSWDELVMALVNSDDVKDLLDGVNSVLNFIANNQTAVNTIVKLVETLMALKGLSIGKNLFMGLITSGKKSLSVIKDIYTLLVHIKKFSFGTTIATFLPEVAAFLPTLASIASFAVPILAVGTAIGFSSGKLQEWYNTFKASHTDDLNEQAEALGNLVTAYESFGHKQRGSGYKKVSGDEAIDALIEKITTLNGKYEEGAITAEEYLNRIGDVSALQTYYEKLDEIVTSGGRLTATQAVQYEQLKRLFGVYNNASAKVEEYNNHLKLLDDYASGNINVLETYKGVLTQVGDQYYFTSQAAKDSAISTQKAIIAEAEQVIKATQAEIEARVALAQALGATDIYSGTFKSSTSLNPSSLLGGASSKETAEIKKQKSIISSAKKALSTIKGISVGGVSSGGSSVKSGTSSGSNSEAKAKATKLYNSYKEKLEKYQKAQKDAYQKGEITASEYYSNVQKRGKKYYDKLKSMGSDYADAAEDMLEEYKSTNTEAVKDIFSEIEYQYKQGNITAQEYYNQLWKYAKKFYANGKIDFESYRDYIEDGYEALFDDIEQKYEDGKITAEEYAKRVANAQASATSKISGASLDGATKQQLQTLLDTIAKEAKKKAAKALKEALVEAAQKAVDEAEKILEQAEADQSKAEALIDALDFYADEEMAKIDKVIDGYNEEIDKLNEKSDLLDEQNDALDDQAERIKLVNELEDAKRQKTVRVFDSKLGWVWATDASRIASAQQALDEFDTTKKREDEKKAIENEVKALEKLIKEKEAEKQAYQDVIDEQVKALNRYNIESELGKTIEQAIFDERTQNFTSWKDSYLSGMDEVIDAIERVAVAQAELESLQSELDYAQQKLDNFDSTYSEPTTSTKYTSKTGAAYTYDSSKSAVDNWNAAQEANIAARQAQGWKVKSWYDDKGRLHYEKAASGSLGVPKSAFYNVNELGDELIVPPRGNFDYLKKGTGVIPANLTKNLMDWGKFNPSTFMGSRTSNVNTDNSISIQNLTVQSNDAKDFVRQLQNLAIVRG